MKRDKPRKADDNSCKTVSAPWHRKMSLPILSTCDGLGKRSAVKVARSVWGEGKAARPYLSPPSRVLTSFEILRRYISQNDMLTERISFLGKESFWRSINTYL